MSLVEREGLWSEEQARAAAEIARRIEQDHLDLVRFSFADQHGLLRGKTIVASEAPSVMRSGCGIASTLLLKDTAHRTVFPVFNADDNPLLRGLRGAADVLMVADPLSFRVLPWAPTYRLAALRRLFRRRHAGAVFDAPDPARRARPPRRGRLRFRRRARGRVPSVQAREPAPRFRRRRPARRRSRGQPAQQGLSVSDGAALRRARPDPR